MLFNKNRTGRRSLYRPAIAGVGALLAAVSAAQAQEAVDLSRLSAPPDTNFTKNVPPIVGDKPIIGYQAEDGRPRILQVQNVRELNAALQPAPVPAAPAPVPPVPAADVPPAPLPVGSAEPAAAPVVPGGRVPRRPSGGASLSPEAKDRANRFIAGQFSAEHSLQLTLGRPTVINFTKEPFRVQLANEQVVDYTTISPTEYSITGKAIGSTVLTFWFNPDDEGGKPEVISYLVRVDNDPEESRRREELLETLQIDINRAFPNSAVKLTYVGNQVLVRGQAKDIEEATHLLRIVGSSLPDMRASSESLNTNGLLLTGDALGALPAVGGLGGALSGEDAAGVNSRVINGRVINMLEVAGIHQVMLKVTVAEVNRSAARAIGADLAINGTEASFFSLLPLATLGTPGTGASFLVNRGDFDLAINALKTLNLARSLAEPNLVTLNGQSASFQVGGQFPVPQITGFTDAGLQGVEFVPFGVQLNFLPNVTDGNRIRLNLQATVSAIDESLGTTIGGGGGGGAGSSVPGLNSRNFQTTVELREGQTLAIAGLIQTNMTASSTRIPLLGDIPYLGRLFSSDGHASDEQELVVLVTPYLAAPVPEGCDLALPGSDMFEPSDLEFYVKGSLVGCRAEDFRTSARTDTPKIKSFRDCQQQFIIGSPGHSLGRVGN